MLGRQVGQALSPVSLMGAFDSTVQVNLPSPLCDENWSDATRGPLGSPWRCPPLVAISQRQECSWDHPAVSGVERAGQHRGSVVFNSVMA
jgi:hypothetical protein